MAPQTCGLAAPLSPCSSPNVIAKYNECLSNQSILSFGEGINMDSIAKSHAKKLHLRKHQGLVVK
ncbi:hypothetical protein BDR06DRAFT_947240 [Suillus hirtellus]|nr:hypothetical protein BDR06DRAFT_947240 [Suillus hirtellus]